MPLQPIPTPYTALLVATAAVLFALTLGVLRSLPQLQSRSRRLALILVSTLLVTAVWCLAYVLQLSSADANAAAFWNNVRLLGPTLVSPSAFLFAAEYTDREAWLRRRRVVALFSVAAVTNALAWTNDVHGLVRQDIAAPPGGSLFTEVAHGPWTLVYGTYNYALMAAAVYMLAVALRDGSRSRVYRGQVGAVLVGFLVPTAANVVQLVEVTRFDVTPIGFAVTVTMFAVALYRYRLLDIRPIARSTVFENVGLGALVVDADGEVVDANGHARRLLERDELVGTSLSELLSTLPVDAGRLADLEEGSDRIETELDGESRWFDVDVSSIRDATGRYAGRVFMFNDVTDEMRRQRTLRERTRQLERQNEQLDQFAGIVSHDLRNPINVARGYLEPAREDPEHLDEIETSLDRMEEIIEDVLALARQSRNVADPEPTDLEAVAAEAWNHVDTGNATLHADVDRAVAGDPARLMQLFENLFRNAVDHGPDDVTVRVGDLDGGSRADDSQASENAAGPRDRMREADGSAGEETGDGRGGATEDQRGGRRERSVGFFVEDDGPGIPEAKRDEVFEEGHTTDADGTGFGLAIVETAVGAHGWSVDVTEGADGGARFEVRTD